MNRRVLTLSVLLIGIFLVFRFCRDNKEELVADRVGPLGFSENSGSFNQSFTALLNAYYQVKDALVEADTVRANAASGLLAQTADSLNVDEIKGDSTGTIRETAGYFAATISGSGRAFAGETGIEEKRREFNMISDALWNLTRTVRYSGQKIYYKYCPDALGHSGAYWLSDTLDIRNPYFGSEMISCGEVADSLDYSKREL